MADVLTKRFDQAAWVLAELRHRGECWALVRHPFMRRWLEGSLTETELQLYAGEHHHAAVALTVATRSCAELAGGMLGEELSRQAHDRDREVTAWVEIALATGWPRAALWAFGDDPLPQTAACECVWTDHDGPLAERLVTVYAFESGVAAVAAAQLEALRHRYGLRDGRASAWFRRRAGRDGPAAVLEAALTGLLPVEDPFALVRRAELANRAYWELLAGIELFGRAARVSM